MERLFCLLLFVVCDVCVQERKWQDTKLELRKILLQKIPLVFIRQFIALRNDASLFPDKDHLVIQLCHFDRNGWKKTLIYLLIDFFISWRKKTANLSPILWRRRIFSVVISLNGRKEVEANRCGWDNVASIFTFKQLLQLKIINHDHLIRKKDCGFRKWPHSGVSRFYI